MYHVELRELRQFGQRAHRFNLSEPQLRALVEPWMRAQQVELGERRWSSHIASLTILEGPQIPLQQLSMSRGWRSAQRQSDDVTDRVLGAAKQVGGTSTPPAAAPAADSSSELNLQADSLGLGILSLIERAPAPLSRAWRLSHARFPERSASESLAVAELAIKSLLDRRLIVLLQAGAADGTDRAADADSSAGASELPAECLESLLRDLDSWTAAGESAVRMRRS